VEGIEREDSPQKQIARTVSGTARLNAKIITKWQAVVKQNLYGQSLSRNSLSGEIFPGSPLSF